MKRTHKIIINVISIFIIFNILMMCNGYYPGYWGVKARLSINNNISDLVVIKENQDKVFAYTDTHILEYSVQSLLGYKKLLFKHVLPKDSNHFYDSHANDWFDVDKTYNVYLYSVDGIDDLTLYSGESKTVTKNHRTYLVHPFSPDLKVLIDQDGLHYWVDKTHYLSSLTPSASPFDIEFEIDDTVHSVTSNKEILLRYFTKQVSTVSFLTTQFDTVEEVLSSGYTYLGNATTQDYLKNLAKNEYYAKGDDVIVRSTDMTSSEEGDHVVYTHRLHPVIAEALLDEISSILK